jgi:hypothetical protein
LINDKQPVTLFTFASRVVAYGNANCTFIGWLVDTEPFVKPAVPQPGNTINFVLNGNSMTVVNELTNTSSLPWFSSTDSQAVTDSNANSFNCNLLLPLLGGSQFADDYLVNIQNVIGGSPDPTVSAVMSGGDWLVSIDTSPFGFMSNFIFTFTAKQAPPVGVPHVVGYSSGNNCAVLSHTVYTSGPNIQTGVRIYNDSGLTQPVVGYDSITFFTAGLNRLYQLNSATGVVGLSLNVIC